MKHIWYRVYQIIIAGIQHLLPWRSPKLLKGTGSLERLPEQLKRANLHHIFLVTTKGTMKRNGKSFLEALDNLNIRYTIYDGVKQDPTTEIVEEATRIFLEEACDGIVAFGGGSVIDCAKITGACAVKPGVALRDMVGLLKVRRKIPPLFVIPTTAGTGSETTVAAVIVDSQTKHKYAISDLQLIPGGAVLDAALTISLPPALTAQTGMDALTHAVEAYTNLFAPREAKENAKYAVKQIMGNLEKAYIDGNNLEARHHMLMGSYYAGKAFTRAYVGNVHAIAHTLGGLYGVQHGLANAVILPYVLRGYGDAVYESLAELADEVGIQGSSWKEKAENFITEIEGLNARMQIPACFDFIKKEDYAKIIKWAKKEANPTYPVPVIWDDKDYKQILGQITNIDARWREQI